MKNTFRLHLVVLQIVKDIKLQKVDIFRMLQSFLLTAICLERLMSIQLHQRKLKIYLIQEKEEMRLQ